MREVFYGVISQGVTPHFFISMEKNKVCSFFGHRDVEITDELYATVTGEIMSSVAFGCSVFYFGGYGTFDELCYKIITMIKEERPELGIKRIYCVAREQYLRKNVRYFDRKNYDDVIYLIPSFEGWYKSIYFRNCAMIDESDFMIFYAEARENSGAYKAYKYAKKQKGKRAVNIWKESE